MFLIAVVTGAGMGGRSLSLSKGFYTSTSMTEVMAVLELCAERVCVCAATESVFMTQPYPSKPGHPGFIVGPDSTMLTKAGAGCAVTHCLWR